MIYLIGILGLIWGTSYLLHILPLEYMWMGFPILATALFIFAVLMFLVIDYTSKRMD